MSNATIEILMPYAEEAGATATRGAPRVDSLVGKVVGFINNDWISLDITYDEFRKLLAEKYEVSTVIEKRKAKSSPLPPEAQEELVSQCQAVITGLGN